MKLPGAQIVVECLKQEGVEVIFGYPGGAIMPVYDALYDAPIKHVLTRHEQGAAHAADGYARSTGKVGVCISTSGPGATNLVTGIATAYMDSVPMVAIAGQVATPFIGTDGFQEVDIFGISLPVVKHNYLVKKVTDIPRIFKEAFYIAATGRPGPVLIDLPKDLTVAETNFKYPDKVKLPGYEIPDKGPADQVKKAAALINRAKKPLICVGGGIGISAEGVNEIRHLVDQTGIPVISTMKGLGAIPSNHKLLLGLVGMHGTKTSNFAVSHCDVLIALGVRFSDRITGRLEDFAKKAQIIHVDIDPAEIEKNCPVKIPIVGDLGAVLQQLSPLVPTERRDIKKWREELLTMKRERPLSYDKDKDKEVTPQYVLDKLFELTKDDTIIVTDVGQQQMWTAQFGKFNHPRNLLTSGGLGTMGFGLPAAIGAQVGNPTKTVVLISGDGSFQMNIQELVTLANLKVPVKILLFDNRYLGMVRQWQELFFKKRYSATDLGNNPDFVKVAEAFNVSAIKVKNNDEVEDALKTALNNEQPMLVHLMIEREANVFPMVAPGRTLLEIIG